MTRESASRGGYGEDYARALLGLNFFDSVLHPEDGAPGDFSCEGLKPYSRAPTDLKRRDGVRFILEVKTGYQRRIPISSRATYDYWLGRVETQPVIILWHDFGSHFRFLVLHEWHQTRKAQTALADPTAPVSFDRQVDFITDRWMDGRTFRKALREERDRAARNQHSLWAASGNYKLFPLNEALFLQYLELAPLLEAPQVIRRKLAREADGEIPKYFGQLLTQEAARDPDVDLWVRAVQAAASPRAPESAERQQFLHFVAAMRAARSGRRVRMPTFGAFSVRCWRAFVAMYPQSCELLAQLLKMGTEASMRWALTLLPVLAITEGGIYEGRAMDLANVAAASQRPSDSYDFRRYFYRGLAEAGVPRYEAEIVQLVRDNRVEEMRSLLRYGWPRDQLPALFTAKLDRPSERDAHLKTFYEVSRETLVGSS